jgi:tight adherence protein B
MSLLVAILLAVALWLVIRPGPGLPRRVRRSFPARAPGVSGLAGVPGLVGVSGSAGGTGRTAAGRVIRRFRPRDQSPASLTVVVQQLAALLKGGRTTSRLWDELGRIYGGADVYGGASAGGDDGQTRTAGPCLSSGSARTLAAARAAALRGSPVAVAIRSASPSAFPAAGSREARIWDQLAACFEIAEASGSPLADVLTRFAAQLEAEDDADAARQTALAGPRATVRLLTWLPLLGLGLGVLLGVDPLTILLGTPMGMGALAAGLVLTVAGRLWSARLVRAAAGTGVL